MNPQGLEQVKKLLERALELPPTERRTFLRGASDDEEIRHEVESLLAEEGNEGPWPEAPIVPMRVRNGSAPKLPAGQRIGPYRVLDTLGEGGMGKVALAVREDDFEKRVALKVVSAERLNDDLLQRFHNERQILARLEHPNISRILDGGTTDDGLPFFAMELVEGIPIDRYCREHELSLEDRLQLFLSVCSALEHAHRNLVVHRDLKPSNILVTPSGVPKVLDFGIARLLDPKDTRELTVQGLAPMTLRYASPEQILNQTVTTATDVFTLGLLLYLLLTDGHPFDGEGKSDLELAEEIRDTDPTPPSGATAEPLRHRLRGDLDSIVTKALRKEPTERYGSVESFAEDIRRYLDGRPVEARRGNWTYQTGKWLRRYWLPVAAASMVMTLSIVFGATVTVLWQDAETEKQLAEREKLAAVEARKESDAVLMYMKKLFRITDARHHLRIDEITALELLGRGEELIREEEDPKIQAEILSTIGQVYTDVGLRTHAEGPIKRAVEVLEQHQIEGPHLAKAVSNLASWYYRRGDAKRAEELYRRSLEIKLEVGDNAVVDVPKTLTHLATLAMQRGGFDEAETLYRQALKSRINEFGEGDLSVATNMRSLGMLYYLQGDFEEAEPFLLRAQEIREQKLTDGDPLVATTLSSLGRVRHALGDLVEAENYYLRAFKIRQENFLEPHHPHVAASRVDLARLYLDLSQVDTAEEHIREALVTLQEVKRQDSWEVAEAESVLGACLARQGDLVHAEPLLKRGYKQLSQIRGEKAFYTKEALRRLEEFKQLSREANG